MCGICGVFSWDEPVGRPPVRRSVEAMTELMAHRGPDDVGYWEDAEHGRLALGFRRLSILDLSPAGHQPMESAHAPTVIAFNGEIYNFRQLRRELEAEGVRFRSRTDTEVLLEALNRWEEDALPRLNGMFALAWYHRRKQKLILARDHAGIKPLFFYHVPGKGLVFGSQLNQLLYAPWGVPDAVDPAALYTYLRLHYVPPPLGLLKGTGQLRPGEYMVVSADGAVRRRRWWELPKHTQPSLKGAEAEEAVAAALDDAVRRQLVADVPVGTFLSGGIDSPLITAIAARHVDQPLQAFTIGNQGWVQDESAHAAQYARALGVRHYLQNLTPDDIIRAIDEILPLHHEPLGDYSTIPTYLISRFARQRITVALSGDGGDELFFGYVRPRSLTMNAVDWKLPRWLRIVKYALGKYGLIPRRNSSIVAPSPGWYYREVNARTRDDDLRKWAPELPTYPPHLDFFRFEGPADLHSLLDFSRYAEYYGQMQRCLRKVDLASMQCSLEVRVPMLDRAVVDVSLQIDPTVQLDRSEGKKVLRAVLRRYVPAELLTTEKRGFSVPLGQWLRGPLRGHVEDLLFGGEPYPEGVFDVEALRRYWQMHLRGERDLKWSIWTLMTLQYWARRYVRAARAFHQKSVVG